MFAHLNPPNRARPRASYGGSYTLHAESFLLIMKHLLPHLIVALLLKDRSFFSKIDHASHAETSHARSSPLSSRIKESNILIDYQMVGWNSTGRNKSDTITG